MAVSVILAAALGLLIGLAILVAASDDQTYMEERARWMAQLREEGAWVMW